MRLVLVRLVLVGLGWVILPANAALAERLVVVELFTSQGCSSCPPADRILGELAQTRDDVLPLALHVDYWDYIGWKDSFGQPAHTARQKAYAAEAGARTIYTPQMIVGGVRHLVGTRSMKIADAIARQRGQPRAAEIVLQRNDGGLRVALRALAMPPGRYRVLLVRFLPAETVAIRHGENAGRTLTYHNVVTRMDEIGRWDGRGRFAAEAPADGPERAAVIVQEGKAGPILAAAVAD